MLHDRFRGSRLRTAGEVGMRLFFLTVVCSHVGRVCNVARHTVQVAPELEARQLGMSPNLRIDRMEAIGEFGSVSVLVEGRKL